MLDEVFDWFREVDERFSTYKETSEISRLNRGELAVRDCHPDVRWVLARCDELREETDGYFDARYASLLAVDPSGLVKGWSVDRGGELLEARGLRNYSINAGGDIRMRGAALPERVLADRDPAPGAARPDRGGRRGERPRARHLRAPTSAASTSSIRTAGCRPPGLLSVTIAGDDLATADAYATAAFAMGERGARLDRDACARTRPSRSSPTARSLSTPGFPFAAERRLR